MHIQALAVDYDGTIARHGKVAEETRAALESLRGSRRVLLVTGRRLEDLRTVMPELTLFDRVVAENGAMVYDPRTQEVTLLGEEPPAALLSRLAERGVPFATGHIIVATHVPHDVEVLRAIRDLGLEWQLIYNKGEVMLLPAGITKATGLEVALAQIGLSAHNTAGVGDAENDHNFLRICEVAAAVANALPAIKERADIVLRRANGRGVAEFIERHVANDLADAPEVLAKYTVELGTARGGQPVRAPVYNASMLVVGSSGSGKSTLTGVFVERLVDQGYQVCVIDPEGDHQGLDPLVTLGSAEAAPSLEEITAALERSTAGVVINLVALNLPDKVRFSSDLLGAILSLRASYGRPHWITLDEAHHLLPDDGTPGTRVLPAGVDGVCFVTLRAGLLASEARELVTDLYVIGEKADDQVDEFATSRGIAPIAAAPAAMTLMEGEGLVVRVRDGTLEPPRRFRISPRRTEHRRHLRKYAGGDLGDSSFYFTGPDGRLNLRAYNVTVFVEMARGVDLETWEYHLRRGDISRWFRERVKDPDVAKEIEEIERSAGDRSAEDTRDEILRLLESRYTAGG
ncbi:MAG: HAD hydrolase family protein [Chloroflexi bacterium]|nr:HAD hydrolase family protein [Chloroflexota bacterium]